MASEPYPEIVFEIDVAPNDVLKLIRQESTDGRIFRIVKEKSITTWQLIRVGPNEATEANFELFFVFRDKSCTLYFSADSAQDSDRLADTVATFLGVVFKGCIVLGPDRRPLPSLPGPSEAGAERIATFLQSRQAMSVEEISKSLTMLQYTVDVNLRKLLDKGVVGCTPSDIVPRKYFLK